MMAYYNHNHDEKKANMILFKVKLPLDFFAYLLPASIWLTCS